MPEFKNKEVALPPFAEALIEVAELIKKLIELKKLELDHRRGNIK